MSKGVFSIDSFAVAYRCANRAFVTSIVINLFTFFLLLFIVLMKAGGVSAFDNFYYAHFLMLAVGIGLSYGIRERWGFAFISLFLLLLIDKAILIAMGLLNPIIGLFVFLVLSYFILRGFKALSYLKNASSEEKEAFSSDSESFISRYRGFVDAFVIIAVLFISSVVIENLFGLLVEHSIISKGLYSYPLGVFVSFMLALIGVYPLAQKSLGTFHIAFLNIILLALATSISTLVPQSTTVPFQPPEYYINAYGYLGHLFLFFSLDSVFHSFWYISFFVLLAINIIRVALKRKFNIRNIGFYITHFSVVFILIAVWYNFFFSYTGIMPLREGEKTNRVFLFQGSKEKLGEDTKDIDFYIKLDKFKTKQWESAYNIYVKKFKNPIPKTISVKTYTDFIKAIPGQFKDVFKQSYKKEKKLTLSPSLTLLSAVGFTFLSTYREDGFGYYLTSTKAERLNRILRRIFLLFGYKGKDLIAKPIKEGREERVYTTGISYKVLKYFENYDIDYVPIPNKISDIVFKKQFLDAVPSTFTSVVEDAYVRKSGFYVLKDVYNNDVKRRDNLADAFSYISRDDLRAQFKPNKAALSFSYLSGEDVEQVWLVDGKSRNSNKIVLNEGAKLVYYWSLSKERAIAIISKESNDKSRMTIVVGKTKKVYSNISKSITEQRLTLGTPYAIARGGYAYFNHVLPNYELYHPYKKAIANIPLHIEEALFENKLVKKLSNDESKQILKKAYIKSDKLWVLNPFFYTDEERRAKIVKVLKEANYTSEPINPFVLLEVSYQEDGAIKKKLTRLSPSSLNVFVVPSSNYTLTFGSRRSFETKYWRSYLHVLEKDSKNALKVAHKQQIEVNRFMYYKGYRFYQTDAKKEDKSYSGIGVSIEPGIDYIYAGFIALCLGIVIMFYVPIKKRSKP